MLSEEAATGGTLGCDVVVLGLGVGGAMVAEELAEAGFDVVGIDHHLVGGECPYYGCIPSKMAIHAGEALAQARAVDGLAGHATVTPDWAPVHARIRDEATDDWDDTVAVERFEAAGGRFVRGAGRFVGPAEVDVDGTCYRAERGVVLATGTAPAVPPIDGLDEVEAWTNRDFLRAAELPRSLVVVGGGTVGCELAQVARRFGVEVTILEGSTHLLPNEEPEACAAVEEVLAAEGINLHHGAKATRVEHAGEGVMVHLAEGDPVSAERLLFATGRRADLAGLDVAAAGLDPDAKVVRIDGRCRAGERLWAIGDVTGGGFTHVAVAHARVVIADVQGHDPDPIDGVPVPRVTFTSPEVGAVGPTEATAREAGIDVAVGSAPVSASVKGWIDRAPGLWKLVADRRAGVLVGATVVAPTASEIVGLLTLAVHAAVPIDRLASMITAYPTLHRGIEPALAELLASA